MSTRILELFGEVPLQKSKRRVPSQRDPKVTTAEKENSGPREELKPSWVMSKASSPENLATQGVGNEPVLGGSPKGKLDVASLFHHDQSHPLSGGLKGNNPIFLTLITPRNYQNNDPSYSIHSISHSLLRTHKKTVIVTGFQRPKLTSLLRQKRAPTLLRPDMGET